MNTKKRLIVVIILILSVLGIAVLGGGTYFFTYKNQQSQTSSQATTTTVVAQNIQPVPAQVTKEDYNLFDLSSYTKVGVAAPTVGYAKAGDVSSGKYFGYHVIIGQVTDDNGPQSFVRTYLFVTKDFKTFVVDTSTSTNPDNEAAQIYAGDKRNSYDLAFSIHKVVGTDTIGEVNPPAIIDEGNFVLVNNGLLDLSYIALLASSTPLTSNVPELWFFVDQYVPSIWTSATSTEALYERSSNHVRVENAQGLVFDYTLLSKEGALYNESVASSTPYTRNTVFYTSSDFTEPAMSYKSYGALIPGACGNGQSTWVLKNISEDDLVPAVRTKRGLQLYSLKNSNHPLNHSEYGSKFFDDSRNSIPTLEKYVEKNPVLIFKDPWGRWIGVGEWENLTPGGCGKPVIYLYPQKPMDVTVSFVNPVRLDVDIPTYSNGWSVLAKPDGTLKDLQKSVTDCSVIDFTHFGSEYAKSACVSGAYPYLYWAGQVNTQYPKSDGGWIIPRAGVVGFLNEKLANMGLNEKERTDMVSYWVPELLKKNALYYRISFLQTSEMNAFIPMKVTPRPDTVFRVFLDWTPLMNVPTVVLQPQQLTQLIRKGFTLVEWGGLKQ